jgi:hypothetical protein
VKTEPVLTALLTVGPSIAVVLHGGAPENLTFIGAGVAAALAVLYHAWRRSRTGEHKFFGPAFMMMSAFFIGAFGPKTTFDICYGLDVKLWGWTVNTTVVTGDIWAVLGMVFGIVGGVFVELLFWTLFAAAAAIQPILDLILRRGSKKLTDVVRRKFPDDDTPANHLGSRVKMQISDFPPPPDGPRRADPD